jgi:hypothetical protein
MNVSPLAQSLKCWPCLIIPPSPGGCAQWPQALVVGLVGPSGGFLLTQQLKARCFYSCLFSTPHHDVSFPSRSVILTF